MVIKVIKRNGLCDHVGLNQLVSKCIHFEITLPTTEETFQHHPKFHNYFTKKIFFMMITVVYGNLISSIKINIKPACPVSGS